MKRFLLTGLTVLLATAIATPVAFASKQTNHSDAEADANGDGKVTLAELRRHNRDARNKN
ncbi:MAG: hypothetical protein F6J95_018190 [Leptolyngbya sp. SIO1E4]|nr:hypothetical protein [Leptolyngbya sp. SIO1E4]